jgi:hypothetical protein
MSETDNIFDLDDFIKKKAPKDIKAAWRKHLAWHNKCEKAQDTTGEIIQALRMIGSVMRKVEGK